MKTFCLLAGLAISGLASAQIDNPLSPRTGLPGDQVLKEFSNKNPLISFPQIKIDDATASLLAQNKIISLEQDNMPCVVPDMKQFNMPNAGTNPAIGITLLPNAPGAIPNPGLKQRLVKP